MISIAVLSVTIAFTISPYLLEVAKRWNGSAVITCGCSQFAVLPTNTPGWLLLVGLAVIAFGFVVMAVKLLKTLWQTRQFRLQLEQSYVHTSYYRGTPIRLVASQDILAVCVGYIRPTVYISTALLRKLNGFELLAVIQHEVAHAQRHDPLQRLVLMALPSWLPGWRTQLEHYLAGQEIVADALVTDTVSIQAAFVKLVDTLSVQPSVAATFFSTNQARIDHWLGERTQLPTLRIGLVAVTMWLLVLLSSYRAFAAEPEAQAFGQCIAAQENMCESTMSHVVQ